MAGQVKVGGVDAGVVGNTQMAAGAAAANLGAAGGDLTGTYPSPTLANAVITNAHISPGAAIAASKVQGGSGAVSGGLYLLSSTTLGAAATFDVASIDQSYSDLILVMILRSARAATNDFVRLQLNHDSGANYEYVPFDGRTSTMNAGALSDADTAALISDACTAASGTANHFSMGQLTIPGYTSTAFFKQFFFDWSGASSIFWSAGAAGWHSTAAVNRIELFANTVASPSNFAIGSQLRIYGRP